MSAAAIDYTKTVAVKGSAKTLLEVIADLIPEGETMTPPISTDDLTARMIGYGNAAARRARYYLVEAGIVRIVGGRGGQAACYELMGLTGPPPPQPPLPLIGEAAPAGASRRRAADGPTLFDQSSADGDTSSASVQNVHQRPSAILASVRFVPLAASVRFVHWLLSGLLASVRFVHWLLSGLLASVRFVPLARWRRDQGAKGGVRNVHLPVDRGRAASLDRARDVRTTTTTLTTTTDARAPAETVATPPPSCRWLGTAHAWCDFRGEHVPMQLHRELRRKLARQPGETDTDLDATLYARYTAIARAIPDAQPLDPTENGFAFWKRMLRSTAVSSTPPPGEPNIFALAAEERRQRWGGKS